jgi:hypothetical protein
VRLLAARSAGYSLGSSLGLRPIEPRIRVHGKAPGDLAFVSSDDFLVSDRFATAWRKSGLRGVDEFEEVELTLRDAAVPNYWKPDLRRSGAFVDGARSNIEWRGDPTCSVCRSPGGIDAIHGFVLSEEGWEGEDIFIATGLPGVAIASQRFKDFVESEKLTNVELVRSDQYEWAPL